MLLVGMAWMAFSFWAFSYSFSNSFLLYNRHSRLPVFGAALLGAGAILGSAYVQWRRHRPLLVACVRQAIGAALALAPLVVVSAVLGRAPDPWHPSADDAMGSGIDFLVLCALGIVSVILLAIALAVRGVIDKRTGGAGDR